MSIKFKCDSCSYIAANNYNLTRHKKSIHSTEKLICENCKKMFNREHHYNCHIRECSKYNFKILPFSYKKDLFIYDREMFDKMVQCLIEFINEITDIYELFTKMVEMIYDNTGNYNKNVLIVNFNKNDYYVLDENKQWVLVNKKFVLKHKTFNFIYNISVLMKEAEKSIRKDITEEWFKTFTLNFCSTTMRFIKCKKIINNCIHSYSKSMLFQKNILPSICNQEYCGVPIKTYETFEREKRLREELRQLGEYFDRINNG